MFSSSSIWTWSIVTVYPGSQWSSRVESFTSPMGEWTFRTFGLRRALPIWSSSPSKGSAPRPVDHGGAEDRPVQPAGAPRFLGLPLGPVVAGARIRPRPQRAHVEETLDAGLLRHREHVGRGLGVEALEGGAVEAMLADDPDEMDDRRAALDGSGKGVGLEHVPRHTVDGLEPAQIGLRPRPDQAAHQEAVGQEGPDHGLADEARAARNEDPLHHALESKHAPNRSS